jgi:hypothetical protein
VLLELRALPLDTLEWHGETARLGTQRELVNALCGRAWLALEGQDQARAVLLYADALRLNRASDDGTTMGGMIRYACDHTVLASLRSALALGLSPALARTVLAPLLEDWSYDPGRAERVIRRDLAALENADEQEQSWSPAQGLEMLRGVERALELTGGPVEEVIRLRAERDPARPERGIVTWLGAPWYLHARHARRNVALTALAVAAFREEHGCWPESLAALDLPAEQTLDTLETEPLAYVSGADWARVGPASWGERAEPWNGAGESPYAWTLR